MIHLQNNLWRNEKHSSTSLILITEAAFHKAHGINTHAHTYIVTKLIYLTTDLAILRKIKQLNTHTFH